MQYFKKCIEKLTRTVNVILLTSAALFISTAAEATLVVIANPSLPVNALTNKQLASLYLGNPVSLGQTRIIPYDLPTGTLAYQEFYQTVLSWDPSQVSSYWSSQIFSGMSATQPQVLNDPAQAISVVKSSPNAIAYVDSQDLQKVHSGIKVIYGDYKIHPAVLPPSKKNANSDRWYSSSQVKGFVYALPDGKESDRNTEDNSNNDFNNDSNTKSGTTDLADAQDSSSLQSQEETNQQDDTIADGAALSANEFTASDQSGQNVWSLIASHMQLETEANNPQVRHWIAWFQQRPQVLNHMLENASPYLYYVYQQTEKRGMPAEFVLLPMIESGYDPNAYSQAGAAGLWQMMPATASIYGLDISWWYDSRRDILMSTQKALDFLQQLHHSLGNWDLAAAAYNVGPGALQSSINRNRSMGKPTDFWSLSLPTQTREYVPKLLAISAIVSHPARYGIKLPFVPDRPFFSAVSLSSQMDLNSVSQMSDVSIPLLKMLNPGLRRFATDPQSKFELLLPTAAVNTFKENFKKEVGKNHLSWQYHEVRSGEDFQKIAMNYHIGANELEKVNGMMHERLDPGMGILVPVHIGATYEAL